MAKLKKISDVLEVAIRIERNGVNFFNKLYSLVKSPEARDVFSFLAAEEEKHIGVCRKLLDKVADYNPRFEYPGEYELFLDGIAYRAVGTFNKIEEAISTEDASGAINLGIDLEMESILFYSELLKQFKDAEKKHIRRVINEEKSHLSKLKSIKDKLKF